MLVSWALTAELPYIALVLFLQTWFHVTSISLKVVK